MNVLTRTGLLPSVSKNLHHYYKNQKTNVEFNNIAVPAPFGLRPFTEYYNPYYPRNCSILCNHPIDHDVNKKRTNVNTFENNKDIFNRNIVVNSSIVDGDYDNIIVPEDLFRRYTDTDSRPQTPILRRKGCRRCLTPDPPNDHRLERTRIVLDLRRSLSQDTIVNLDKSINEKLILLNARSIQPVVPTAFVSTNDAKIVGKLKECTRHKKQHSRKKMETKMTPITNDDNREQKNVINALSTSIIKAGALKILKKDNDGQSAADENKITKRSDKAKKKKKKPKKSHNKSGKRRCNKMLTDPGETQVASCNAEQPICLADGSSDEKSESVSALTTGSDKKYNENVYLTAELIKDIKRELDLETLDNESDPRRHMMLEEVMHHNMTIRKSAVASEQIRELKEEMCLFQDTLNMEHLLKLPRTFTRRNARFELPINREALVGMKPLQYLSRYTYITSDRKLMYNRIFNNYLEDKYTVTSRVISSEVLKDGLSKIIGHHFTDEELSEFFNLIDFPSNTCIDFRTWCGIAALSERLLGPLFASSYPSKLDDSPYELEMVDFESLTRRTYGLTLDHHLLTILNNIRDI